MIQIDPITFDGHFRRFEEAVYRLSGQPFTSFGVGLPHAWEDYKGWVALEARRRLSAATWKTNEIGSGQILERVIQAIEINESKGYRNNLVRWTGRYGDEQRTHKALLRIRGNDAETRAAEQTLFRFFREVLTGEEAFEALKELVGPRYDVIAYLHFVLDSRRFMPVAPRTFAEAFRLLDVDVESAGKCSWASYVEYNEVFRSILTLLRSYDSEASLIDAHSFCWMLVRMEQPEPPARPPIPLPVPLDDPRVGRRSSARSPRNLVMTSDELAARDQEKRLLGERAQQIALESEWRRLREAGHPNPERVAKAVWEEVNRGYDIESTELDGTPRFIEVKAARKDGEQLSFYVSPNEWKASQNLPNYHFYLVLDVNSQAPSVRTLEGHALTPECLTPASYIASITHRL